MKEERKPMKDSEKGSQIIGKRDFQFMEIYSSDSMQQ